MLSVAFKEWAAICLAIARGRQAIILRKGGIAETDGQFRPEHDRFLLYPTFFHEHRTGITSDLAPLLDAAEADRPAAGIVRFSHFVTVSSVWHVTDLDRALALESLHGWTPDIVRQRFHYRSPGLFVLAVRAYQLTGPKDVAERPEYAGCKTWVQINPPVPVEESTPVLGDREFAEYSRRVAAALGGPVD